MLLVSGPKSWIARPLSILFSKCEDTGAPLCVRAGWVFWGLKAAEQPQKTNPDVTQARTARPFALRSLDAIPAAWNDICRPWSQKIALSSNNIVDAP